MSRLRLTHFDVDTDRVHQFDDTPCDVRDGRDAAFVSKSIADFAMRSVRQRCC